MARHGFAPVMGSLLALSTSLLLAAGSQTLTVPIRWCALQGTSAAVNPACVGETSTKRVLFRRYTRTTAAHFLPFCNVSLRSAATFVQPAFPVIADPCNGSVNPSCKGVQGDVILGAFEHIQMMQSCAAAWNALGVGDIGVLAVDIRRFIDAQGTPTGTLGATTDYGSVAGMEVAVIDNDFTLATPNQPAGCVTPEPFVPDPTDQILGHEFGHSHSLPHTMPNMGDPSTLMNPLYPLVDFLTSGGTGQTDTVCPNPAPPLGSLTQCGRVRIYGLCNTNGIEVDPPPVVDSLPLEVGNASPDHVDLRKVGLISDSNFGKGTFFWHAGLFPRQIAGVEYAFALDVDADPGTGGDPGLVGLPLTLPGAELVGRVEVSRDAQSGSPTFGTVGRLWRFVGGSFIPVPSPGSTAREITMQILQAAPASLPDELPWGTFVDIEFDRTLLEVSPGVPATTVRFQASATDGAALRSPSRDLPPPGDLFLVAPPLPACSVTPAEAAAGTVVTVSASGLSRNRSTQVLLGSAVLANGTTDSTGATASQFVVPVGTVSGTHAVSIEIYDATDAVTADCSLSVLASPPGAGEVMEGMHVSPAANGQIRLSWQTSCASADTDYEIYEGSLGDFHSHVSKLCSTGGATTATISPGPASRYYLIVASNGAREGSYGTDSAGTPRPRGALACRPQELSCP